MKLKNRIVFLTALLALLWLGSQFPQPESVRAQSNMVTTRWSPDTCQCVVEYEWDRTQAEDVRVHTYTGHVQVCSIHQAVAAGLARYTTVMGENQNKNKAIGLAGSVVAANIDQVAWAFNASRQVLLTVPGISGAQKKTLQAAIDTQLGAGKVIVQ
jgi:hypothetical protein